MGRAVLHSDHRPGCDDVEDSIIRLTVVQPRRDQLSRSAQHLQHSQNRRPVPKLRGHLLQGCTRSSRDRDQSQCVHLEKTLEHHLGLLFSRGRGRAALCVPPCILLTALPPLGIIGWASPLLSAGVLFPGSKWFGLALITVFLIAFRFKAALSVVGLALCALLFHFHHTQPHVPAGWEAVNTDYGGTGQGDPDFTTEYNTAQTMQTTILESHATVLLFPEHLLTHWNQSTDAFWGDTLTALASQHRIVLMGAGINPPSTSRNPFAQKRYLSVLLARGEQNTALYQERIPVPIAMWRPLSDDGVPLKLFARGTNPHPQSKRSRTYLLRTNPCMAVSFFRPRTSDRSIDRLE